MVKACSQIIAKLKYDCGSNSHLLYSAFTKWIQSLNDFNIFDAKHLEEIMTKYRGKIVGGSVSEETWKSIVALDRNFPCKVTQFKFANILCFSITIYVPYC